MELNEYQERAMQTCMPSSDNFAYMMLNLVGEVGELASKCAKAIRKEKFAIKNNQFESTDMDCDPDTMEEEINFENELMKEAGDILWQLAGVCEVRGWLLGNVAQMNLDKLSARKKAGTIDGNGDGITGKERTK